MINTSAVCKIYLDVSKNLFYINFKHLHLRVKDSFGTDYSFHNDFKGANTRDTKCRTFVKIAHYHNK